MARDSRRYGSTSAARHSARGSGASSTYASSSRSARRTASETRTYDASDVMARRTSAYTSEGSRESSSRDYSRGAARYTASKKANGMSLGRKIALGITCTFVVALAAAGIAAGLWYGDIMDKLAGSGEHDDITSIADVENDEPYYVLILGSDSRSEDGTGSRSDSMIVARIDEANQDVSLISIPRDLYVYMDGYGYQKINAATAYGGYDYAIQIVNQLLDIEINYYVFVYFSGFEDLVDALGGVTVEVPEGTYYDGVWVEAGDAVEINGEEALVLARCRKGYPVGTGAYAKGDYQRTLNQRNLIKAIAKEVLDTDVSELPSLLESLVECVDTNMGAERLLSLAKNMQGMDVDSMDAEQLPVAGSYDGSAWVACMYEDVFQVLLANFKSGTTLTDGIEGFDDEFVNASVGDDYVAGDCYWYTYYEDKYGDFTVAPQDDSSDEDASETE